MQFLYVGRLDKEKWIASLIFCIEKLIKTKKHFHIDIYGEWSYSTVIKSLSHTYPKYITYHWRKNKKEIIWQRSRADYFIMPSTFLETFWLTACESLLCGVPVIWNKKWWLIPFIDDTLDIQQSIWTHDWEKLYNSISNLINNNVPKTQYNNLIQSIKETYTITKRIQSIENIIQKQWKILMISDFINYNWGGIETHIHDASQLLDAHNYHTTIYGHQAPIGRYTTLKKLMIMLVSLCNIWDRYMIHQKIKKNSIWLVWRHSISRIIGRLPIRWTSKNIKQIITHHELGLFHPFPSQTIHESQIPDARSLSAFVQAGQTDNFFKKIAIAVKYMMIRSIHKQLQKKIKTHIVPSEWMVLMVRKRHPHADIICVPHFVTIK